MLDHTATYSPDDNKLRLYPAYRLPADEYARMKANGFKWAPRQEIFVAPMWTPERENLLLEMCGEIGDEDTSLMDRAEDRSERFEEYRDKRAADAESAMTAVNRLCDGIPFGQPILVGHHSERHARKDAERIENGMRRAVKMWQTSNYWTDRAGGAIRHAKYKERPDVRARRIKGLEKDRRKCVKNVEISQVTLKVWATLHDDSCSIKRTDGQPSTFLERAKFIAGRTNTTSTRVYMGLNDGSITPEDAQKEVIADVEACIARNNRWIAHIDNRLAYERAMLADAGGTAADKTGPEKGGACKCWASPGYGKGWSYIVKVNKVTVSVLDNWGNSCDVDGTRNFTRTIPFDKLTALLTAADVAAARADGRLHETQDKTGFYLADKPEPIPAPEPAKDDVVLEGWQAVGAARVCEDSRAEFRAMKNALSNGTAVQTVSAPQLFPTPKEVAEQVADLADIRPGMRVLEPSAGTGALLGAMGGRMFGHNPERGEVVAVEINGRLADALRPSFPLTDVRCADFLQCNGDLGKFDRILMNPPFENAADILHIEHARTFLMPGGRLVAVCANGPRQRAKLQPIATEWIDLPAGSFKQSGTMVNAAIVVIDAEGN